MSQILHNLQSLQGLGVHGLTCCYKEWQQQISQPLLNCSILTSSHISLIAMFM